MILLISNKYDVAIDYLIKELKLLKKPFSRLNTEDFINFDCSIFLDPSELIIKNNNIFLSSKSINSIYYRRPGRIGEFSSSIGEKLADYLSDQWKVILQYLENTHNKEWMSRPSSIYLAECKPFQLERALSIGFNIPDTLITNDYHEAISFINNNINEVIVKSLSSSLITDQNKEYFIFTNSSTVRSSF